MKLVVIKLLELDNIKSETRNVDINVSIESSLNRKKKKSEQGDRFMYSTNECMKM